MLQKRNGMVTPTEKSHNKHLDLLQDYKIHLVKYIDGLERLDKQSEFAKKWNETIIKERKQEAELLKVTYEIYPHNRLIINTKGSKIYHIF